MLYARWLVLKPTGPSSRFTAPFHRLIAAIRAGFRCLAGSAVGAPGAVVVPAARMRAAAAPWRMNGIVAGSLALLAGAAGGCAPTAGYVAADRATYDAVAPEYSAYFTADPALAADQKDRRGRTLAAWKLRLDAAQPTTAPSIGN